MKHILRTLAIVLILFLALVAGIVYASFTPAPSKAADVRFTVETGVVYFKWGVDDHGLGFPHFAPPKYYIEPGFEFVPPKMDKLGLSIVAGFRWQALGREVRLGGCDCGAKSWSYVDGPKIGIRGSWSLLKGGGTP